MHLSLSNAQLDIVRNAARRVPPPWRSRFLEAIADRLLGIDPFPHDDDVYEAVRHVLSKLKLSA